MIKLFGGNEYIPLKFWTFPAGERSVRIEDTVAIERYKSFTVDCHYQSSDDLIDLLLLVNAIRNVSANTRLRLEIPYFPYARQDRVMSSGESLSLQVAVSLIKSCGFWQVEVFDPHSDVLQGMFEPGVLLVRTQAELLQPLFEGESNFAIVSPDAGALKKIYKLSEKLGCDAIEGGKVRDVKTGKILKSKLDTFDVSKYSTLVITDDICDGGRTFTELGSVIRAYGFKGSLKLFVTHGVFSQGMTVFEDIFDEVKCVNNMRSIDEI